MSEMTKEEKIISAIDKFKDWSNYLLVTTVAALGWVTTENVNLCPEILNQIVTWCFATSIVFGIFTLALIPVVTESINSTTESFYTVKAKFRAIWASNIWTPSIELKFVCWPQHVFFIAGIVLYAYGVNVCA